MRLEKIFYSRSTLIVASEMLGKYLVCGDKIGRIVETEAYLGSEDLASHARFKSRKRNYLMFGAAGIAYVYFTYGMYHMLNITTEKEDTAGAVLIRALEPISGITGETNGPGKLTRTLGITREQNGYNVTQDALFLEDRHDHVGEILATPRIGIDYAGNYKEKPWRFLLKSSEAMMSN